MAIEQPTTLRVVTAGEVVEAEWMPTGVPGLALVGRPVTSGWRLVHIPTGRAVSRSAEHPDPDVVRNLARRIASLADWTEPNVAVSVPRLRQGLDQAIAAWQAEHRIPAHADAARRELSAAPADPEPDGLVAASSELGPGGGLAHDLEALASKLRGTEHERLLLREVVRRLHAVLAPGAFADSLETLSHADREFVHSLVADENAQDATAVVQAIRRASDAFGPRPSGQTARVATGGTRSGAAAPRPPTRPRTGRMGGPDAAAS
ncbi:MAG TPA: hypothetical protein VMR97_10335 [Acidimicrobiales bacterium]|nr:hypothetical protein [Acidimicrobiales bacterium]